MLQAHSKLCNLEIQVEQLWFDVNKTYLQQKNRMINNDTFY